MDLDSSDLLELLGLERDPSDLKLSDLEPSELEAGDLKFEGLDREDVEEVDLEDAEREGVDLRSSCSIEAMPLRPVVLRLAVELEAERLGLEPLPEAERVTPLVPLGLLAVVVRLLEPDLLLVDGLLVLAFLDAMGTSLVKTTFVIYLNF